MLRDPFPNLPRLASRSDSWVHARVAHPSAPRETRLSCPGEGGQAPVHCTLRPECCLEALSKFCRTPSKSPVGSRACSALWVSVSTGSVRGRLATTCHWRCRRSELCVRAGSGLGGHGSSARVPRPTSLGYRSHRSWRLEPEPSSMD